MIYISGKSVEQIIEMKGGTGVWEKYITAL